MVFLSICTALYDYTPQTENELALKEGELVYVLEKSDEDDWWQAKKRAPSDSEEEPVGLIPNNYVDEAKPTHQAKALYDYSRQTDEELSFSEDALLSVYDTSDPEWTLVGLDGEYGFAPANYIEIIGATALKSPTTTSSPDAEQAETTADQTHAPASISRSGPEAALAGIMHGKSPSADAQPTLPPRNPQLTPDDSDEEPPPPSLPRRPDSQQLSPSPTQYASPRSPTPPIIAASSPHNRAVSQRYDEDDTRPNAGGYHLYNISEMVTAMGKSKKMPTTLGLNLATGQIMIAPEKSRDGPQQEWSAEKLTHYSIEGKHVFMELIRPSKSVDFHAGAKDTAQEIVAALGEIAGATRAEGLREVLEAAGSGGSQKSGQVLYDFMAQGDDEVTVAVGDDVIVLDDTKSDDWWMVRRQKNGKEGVVPSSYVEITGVISTPSHKAGLNAGKSIVEQNRLEEERLAKQAVRSSKTTNAPGSEVGQSMKLPTRGSSMTNDNNSAPQRSKKETKSHGRSTSASKSKPDTSKLRTWTDRTGAFKVEAQFIGLKDAKIHLHKLNGVKIAVPVAKMAIEDLEYVESVTGVSLEDDKPLSDIKRRSTQAPKSDEREKPGASAKAGASVDNTKSSKPEGKEYDWFDFFLKAGVSPYQCERYAFNFHRDSMDEGILSEITPSVLRTLGLKEGDILRVMKYLDNKFGRTSGNPAESSTGGLYSGPGGALRNNTSKGRPAPPVQTNDLVDGAAFKQKSTDEGSKGRQDSVSSPSTSIPPQPPAKDDQGFDDDAWSVKPSKQSSVKPEAAKPVSQGTASASQQPTLTGSLLDLSTLSPPLQPTPAHQQSQQVSNPPQTQATVLSLPQQQQQQQPQAAQQQQQQQQQQLQSEQTGANPSFFSQLGQSQSQNLGLPPNQAFGVQSSIGPQQTGLPRQRPQVPQQIGQPGSILPPPPARPLSAPQTQYQTNNFAPPPLQPQLTGYQPQSQFSGQVAPPGQSLNDLNNQRLYQQQMNQQQQFFQPQQLQQIQPQPTGFMPQTQNLNQFTPNLQPQATGFQQPAFQNPYVSGQQQGSPFADPRGPKPQFQSNIQPQLTGFQQQPTGFQPQPAGFMGNSQMQQQGPLNTLQPMQTGINRSLPPALQPQNTGVVNGFSRLGFGQGTPTPPVPPVPQMPPAAPLQPQRTGPAPNVRFGTQPANKLVPQPTGRKANLAAATPSNPFGF